MFDVIEAIQDFKDKQAKRKLSLTNIDLALGIRENMIKEILGKRLIANDNVEVTALPVTKERPNLCFLVELKEAKKNE